jgi:hypothetical protein
MPIKCARIILLEFPRLPILNLEICGLPILEHTDTLPLLLLFTPPQWMLLNKIAPQLERILTLFLPLLVSSLRDIPPLVAQIKDIIAEMMV